MPAQQPRPQSIAGLTLLKMSMKMIFHSCHMLWDAIERPHLFLSLMMKAAASLKITLMLGMMTSRILMQAVSGTAYNVRSFVLFLIFAQTNWIFHQAVWWQGQGQSKTKPIPSGHCIGEDPVGFFNSDQDEDEGGDQDQTTNNQKTLKVVTTSFVFTRIC